MLVVRIPAHELALLLGMVSHSFQVVAGVEVRLQRKKSNLSGELITVIIIV